MTTRNRADASVPAKSSGVKLRRIVAEPGPVNSRQSFLTQEYLEPSIADLEAFFLAVRNHLDVELQAEQPFKLGKAYPLGQCLEISMAVESAIRKNSLPEMTSAAARGHEAFRKFRASGGEFRRVWGDLRQQFFQNAFQLGSLYVDVSNDTVVITKPKIEILPFEEADLRPIIDFHHFMEIAGRYWGGRFYPNHILPALAPYCPLVYVNPEGAVLLRECTDYMISMVAESRFTCSESVLRGEAMPEALFSKLRSALSAASFSGVASSLKEGRKQALHACQDYRAKRWYANQTQTMRIINDVDKANGVFRSVENGATAAETQITIDGRSYDTSSLSENARQQIANIRAVDDHAAHLGLRLALTETARSVYSDLLLRELEKGNTASHGN